MNNLGTVSSLTGLAVLRLCDMCPQGKPWLLMSTESPRLLESGYIGVEAGGEALGDAIPALHNVLALYPRIQCVMQN